MTQPVEYVLPANFVPAKFNTYKKFADNLKENYALFYKLYKECSMKIKFLEEEIAKVGKGTKPSLEANLTIVKKQKYEYSLFLKMFIMCRDLKANSAMGFHQAIIKHQSHFLDELMFPEDKNTNIILNNHQEGEFIGQHKNDDAILKLSKCMKDKQDTLLGMITHTLYFLKLLNPKEFYSKVENISIEN